MKSLESMPHLTRIHFLRSSFIAGRYLEYNGLFHTLDVLCCEAGMPRQALDRAFVQSQLRCPCDTRILLCCYSSCFYVTAQKREDLGQRCPCCAFSRTFFSLTLLILCHVFRYTLVQPASAPLSPPLPGSLAAADSCASGRSGALTFSK